jgi:mannose-6-phosphate isomerase-like protein (cupin superfamily)
MTRVPAGEANHYHDFHEYYVVLHGRATLRVEGKDVPLEAGIVVMVQPGERHRVIWIDPDVGARWIVIKERSTPDGKIVVPESDDGSPSHA